MSSTQSQQQQPATSSTLLEPFYTDLLDSAFPTSRAAIEFCRNICAQYGFTVKQESSTHRNIYVYCSREGLPDSVRNPKRSPKRKRPSKRCDCKWRVVLNENKETHTWKFRKSNNPEAMIHNHSLMRPEEIERGWPKEVHEMICRLARERMSTQEIRQQVQAQFSNISWNERRFYNRLSEERQKIRQQETVERAHRLTATWTKVCMAAAGCDELTDYAQNHVIQLLNTICNMAQVSIETLEKNVPVLIADDQPISTTNEEHLSISSSPPLSASTSPTITMSMNHYQELKQEEDWQSCAENDNGMRRYSLPVSEPDVDMIKPTSRQGSWQAGTDLTATSTTVVPTKSPPPSQQQEQQEVPKNFTLVVIPKHAYLVKVHNQRSLNEMQIQRTHRRSRSIGPGDDGSDLHMRKQTKLNHHHQPQPPHMISINNTMPPPPSLHRSMMPPPPQQQSQMPLSSQHYQTQQHTIVYPPPPPSTYDHNTMSLPSTSTANYIQQPFQYTNMQHRQPSSQDCNDLSQQQQQDDANIAFPPLDTSSSTIASTPSPVSTGTPPTATVSVIPFGSNTSTTTPTTTTTTTTTTTATSSNNSVDSSFMPIQQPPPQRQHRTKKSHRRHSYNNVHPSFSYPMMSPQTMYHQKQQHQQVVGMSVVGNGRPVDNRQHHHNHHHHHQQHQQQQQQQHRVPSSMSMTAPPPPQQHQQTMMVSTVPEHGTPRPDQQIPCYDAGNGSYW
ncbi:hypothetical protein INT45_010729 [Circinella minor]|uniref:FAR1 domain-containing protein n=1 Tax=Circinella minor TaxID=1195481 RepID=A0A8H7VKZ5_9FUNG|nr:hypothetical protein INT45_010729 [Circinella minor]